MDATAGNAANSRRPPSGFRSPEGRARYVEAYDATLRLWPVAFETLRLPTRYGETHVIASGPRGAEPLLLLHAAAFSATDWLPNIASLAGRFRTYAIDILGEPGKSVQTRALRERTDACEWLLDLMDGLQVPRARMAGHSFGGWLTASLALHAPDRLSRIALLAPAATVYPFSRLAHASIRTGRLQWVLPSRLVTAVTLRTMFVHPDRVSRTFVKQFAIGVKTFRFPAGGVFPSAFSDEELRRLRVPTLLLVADGEMIYPPQKALERARQLIPELESETIRSAGHALNFDQAEWINTSLLEFFGGSG